MMRRLGQLFLVALAINGSLLAGRLAAPSNAVACTCIAIDPGAPRLSGEEPVVVVGVVGAADGRGNYAFTLERVFKGDLPPVAKLGTGRQVFADGTEAWNSCGRDHTPGQHIVLAGGLRDGVIDAGSCSPYETVDSVAGKALLREATALFGPGQVPRERISVPEPGPAGLDLATIAIVAVMGMLVVIVAGVVLGAIGRGGRDSSTESTP